MTSGRCRGAGKMRVALARILLMRPDAYRCLDEPKGNHLDLESLIWLEQFLKAYDGALSMTSAPISRVLYEPHRHRSWKSTAVN